MSILYSMLNRLCNSTCVILCQCSRLLVVRIYQIFSGATKILDLGSPMVLQILQHIHCFIVTYIFSLKYKTDLFFMPDSLV